jgi:ferritin-like metal-binding protein YciE
MSSDAMKTVYVQGLQAIYTASQQGRDTAAATLQAATAPELKQQLEAGTQVANQHAQRIEELFRLIGTEPSGTQNEIMQGIQTANTRIMGAARDGATRDAGIIASGQIALHYQIAAYGTLAAHAKALGLQDAAATLHGMVDECRQADQRYTQLAEQLINPRATQAA